MEDTATGAVTRNVNGFDGQPVATTAGQSPTVLTTDEYGNRANTSSAIRYGWHGGMHRSTETLTGLTLMGVRLYTPPTGRFLSADPIPGGSCNAYDYACADPVDNDDVTGCATCPPGEGSCRSHSF